MSKKTPAIEARSVHKSFRDADRSLKVLRGVDLAVNSGQAVAIVGVSGSGKSTLLHLLAGLDQPTKGRILISGKPYSVSGSEASALERAKSIGIVYQFHHLLPEFNALENVMLPGLVAGLSKSAAREKAGERLADAGLADRARHRPAKLSGGERQRALLALALAQEAPVMLLDEPTSSLDLAHQISVMNLVRNVQRRRGGTVLVAMHDLTLAAQYCDRLVMLAGGRSYAEGSPGVVLTRENISKVYGAQVLVLSHPQGGTPVILP